MTKKEKLQLERFVHFGALLYTKSWISAPQATEAPAQDLQLWYDLKKYEQIDPQIGIAARKVVENHILYLSDELVGLALFSDNVSAEEKLAGVQGSLQGVAERKVRGNTSIKENEPTLGDFVSAITK